MHMKSLSDSTNLTSKWRHVIQRAQRFLSHVLAIAHRGKKKCLKVINEDGQ